VRHCCCCTSQNHAPCALQNSTVQAQGVAH
jgi:hypothetical protein